MHAKRGAKRKYGQQELFSLHRRKSLFLAVALRWMRVVFVVVDTKFNVKVLKVIGIAKNLTRDHQLHRPML